VPGCVADMSRRALQQAARAAIGRACAPVVVRACHAAAAVRGEGQDWGMARDRPRIFAGIGLPLRALVHMARDPHDRGPLLLVASLLIVGTAFYAVVEGWSIVDAVYFCAMSLATVGYGDVVPETDVGKLFTVVYVLAGIGILVSFFTALTSHTLTLLAARRAAREPGSVSPPP
jgi:voltage-gated potassium channel